MALYQSSVLKNYLKQQDSAAVKEAYKNYAKYFLNPIIQENIRNSKEEQFQATFLTELFVKVLGYKLNPNPEFDLTTEFKNEKNNRKADGAILQKEIALGVIELKGTKTKDLESIRRQAFDYKANQKGCVYVITSNFEKLRFYINDATEFIEFNLFELSEPDFELFYLCLCRDNLLSNLPLKIKEDSLTVEEQITKNFYKDYSIFKRELFRDLVKRNAKSIRLARQEQLKEITTDESYTQELQSLDKNVKLALFKKSQKLIDRFLFIFFSEDRGLLPPNSTLQILNKWKADVDFGDERPLYNLFKQYFHYLDTGRKGTQSRAEIYAYNGGLFQPDTILDSLEIEDDLLYRHTQKLAAYDFASQVDVNILGHIFENSLNEIESVNAEIEGAEFDKQKSKRKKDGVYYTPKYITKYIVENTVGKSCEEKKKDLGFQEAEYFKSRANRPKKKLVELVQLLDDYREWLLQLTICDPACGSGAFLNQALDFLIKEHRYIDELKARVLGGGLVFADIENTILENNIYGVDLNEESVEIAKLSLWLRTAQPRRKLNDLSSNIKCGNSLIDDKKVAGNKAFNWEQEFPKIFEKGGFDIVIGNPPYLAGREWPKELKQLRDYFSKKYDCMTDQYDLYALFIQKCKAILNEKSYFSFITPNTWYMNEHYSALRCWSLRNFDVYKIADFKNVKVFKDATVLTSIFIFKPIRDLNKIVVEKFLNETDSTSNISDKKLWDNPEENYLFNLEINSDSARIMKKMLRNAISVGDVAETKFGVKVYQKGKGKPKQKGFESKVKYFESLTKDSENHIKYLRGKNVDLFRYDENVTFLNYGLHLAEPRSIELFTGERILVRRIVGSRIIVCPIAEIFIADQLLHTIKPYKMNHFFLAAIIQSSLMKYYFVHRYNRSEKTFPEIRIGELKSLPIIQNTDNALVKASEKYSSIIDSLHAISDSLIRYVVGTFSLEKISRKIENWHNLDFGDFIQELNKAIKKNNKVLVSKGKEAVPTLTKKEEFEWLELFEENKKKAIELQNQIDQTEREIDRMVYELYELTEEDIAIVENS